MTTARAGGALDGIRVVDCADEKGELCGRLLADLGAEVLRIEAPGGALSRGLPPFDRGSGQSLYFALRNAGKQGARIDPDEPRDRDRLAAWLDEADLLIDSEMPGSTLDACLSELAEAPTRADLVRVSITDFGRTGPYCHYLGTDMIGFAMGGMMIRAGRIEKPPVVAPGALAYDSAGITAAYAALLGLWQRLDGGHGQHLDVSVMESVINLADWAIANYSLSPSKQQRAGAGIYTLYRCADGYIRMIILVTHHWKALLDWIGNPPALQDPALDQFIVRLGRMDEIVAAIEHFFRDKRKVDVAREAQDRGIPATPLFTPAEVVENEHTQARGTFLRLPIGGGTLVTLPAGFLMMDGSRIGPRSGPPDPDAGREFTFSDGTQERAALMASITRGGFAAGKPPLLGIRVADFGVGAVGVEVGRLLAEYGADVVKIETHQAPDFIRAIMGSLMNPCFASSSRSKRSLGVDLKSERGLALVRQLVAESDVMIENNAVGVMDRLGLGAEAVHAQNPELVSFSSQLVGSVGPWKHWIGYGPSTHPLSGLQHLWNYPEDVDRPAGSTNVHPDHLVGRVGACAVMAGLIQRRRTRRGAHFEAAQFETIINMLGDWIAKEQLDPGSVAPLGNSSERGFPWGCFPCAGDDEWCVINVRSDEEWARLRKALGEPAWSQDETLADLEGRRSAADRIERGVSEWTLARSPREVMENLQEQGIPAAMLSHPEHQMQDPQLLSRGFIRTLPQEPIGELRVDGAAFVGSALSPAIVTAAPGLGQHTRSVAAERLGLSDEEIEELVELGVLEPMRE